MQVKPKTIDDILQSHLYGIEIFKAIHITQLNLRLQSHLYGIEICLSYSPWISYSGTPIAPLWNWNYTKAIFCSSAKLLQSHLYGIEITVASCVFVGLYLLQSHLYGIEMRTARKDLYAGNTLQSHLYGIEITQSNYLKNRFSDSNRTFMELK